MQLAWIRCDGNGWYPLKTVNLAHEHFNGMEGVYVIWWDTGTGPNPQTTVRVGQGVIRDRIQAHRNDPEVQQYGPQLLRVTWASVDVIHRNGIEVYLAQQLKPRVGALFPNAVPIPVNLP